MMIKYPEIEIYLYGSKVGTLFDDGVRITFLYSTRYRSKGIEVSPIKLNTDSTNGRYTNSDHDIYRGLAGIMADSLPDSNGEAIMDRYFESQGLYPREISVLHRLAFIGDRGMGALEYRPKEKELLSHKDTTIDELMCQ
jgi:serine/threonine-protein kinase HipA